MIDRIRKCETPNNNELIAYKLEGVTYYEQGGVVGDEIWIRRDADGIYEARAGVTILGSEQNINDQENPFADDYYENYVKGRAITREKAIELLVKDYQELVRSLWE